MALRMASKRTRFRIKLGKIDLERVVGIIDE